MESGVTLTITFLVYNLTSKYECAQLIFYLIHVWITVVFKSHLLCNAKLFDQSITSSCLTRNQLTFLNRETYQLYYLLQAAIELVLFYILFVFITLFSSYFSYLLLSGRLNFQCLKIVLDGLVHMVGKLNLNEITLKKICLDVQKTIKTLVKSSGFLNIEKH